MKLVSWNVNGLRGCMDKGFMDFFQNQDADVFCVQETKLQEGQLDLQLPGYHQAWNYAEKKGYSGTAIFTKEQPVKTTQGIGVAEFDQEGRVLTVELAAAYVVTAYAPNSQRGLVRLDFRMGWDTAFRQYVDALATKKPVLISGDFNVAHMPIDLKNPQQNEGKEGYTTQERDDFSKLLASGFSDTFRSLHPDAVEYTWWTYMYNARENNVGWRLDYWLVSNDVLPKVASSVIEESVMGSDHAPCVIQINI